MGVIKQIEVSVEDRLELERIVRAVSSEVRMVERARIVLAAAEGLKGVEIAGRVGCSEPTVVKWRGRYAERGIEGLKDAPRSGAPAWTSRLAIWPKVRPGAPRRAAVGGAVDARPGDPGAVDREGVHPAGADCGGR